LGLTARDVPVARPELAAKVDTSAFTESKDRQPE